MFWISLVVVSAVIFVIAAVVLGAGGTMPDAYRDRPDLDLPQGRPMTAQEVDALAFPVGLRGYRMSEVDTVLDRLVAEVAMRDARIAELEDVLSGRPAAARVVAGSGSVWGAPAVVQLEKPRVAEPGADAPAGPLVQGDGWEVVREDRPSAEPEAATDEPEQDERAADEPARDKPAEDEPAQDERARGERAQDERAADEPARDRAGKDATDDRGPGDSAPGDASGDAPGSRPGSGT